MDPRYDRSSDPVHVKFILKIPRHPAEVLAACGRTRQVAVQRSVLRLASVRAFHLIHKVRFGGLSEAVRPDLDPENSDGGSDYGEGGVDRVVTVVTKMKSRRSKLSAGAAQAPGQHGLGLVRVSSQGGAQATEAGTREEIIGTADLPRLPAVGPE
jgi:hypothetical protein